jgi:carbamoyltransferase
MYILGINAFHADSSAALLKNGKIIQATEEERFTRIKHWAGLPLKSIEYCLSAENISINDIDSICIGRDPKAKFLKKLKYIFSNPISAFSMLNSRIKNKNDLGDIRKNITSFFGSCPEIKFVEHHTSHLASAFYSSPFDSSAIISIDGSGDFSTLMIAEGYNNKINIIESVDFPVSIGLFYTATTQFLGFPYYGDEYKVMGLSPYGNPIYLDEFKKMIYYDENKIMNWDKSYFELEKNVITYKDNLPTVSKLYTEKWTEIFGKCRVPKSVILQKHMDIAASLQKRTEELIFEVIERVFKKTNKDNLCIAGGVAQNSVANGKILKNTSFKNLYIPSAGHDAGISMGSAQFHYFDNLNNKRVDPLYNANLGIEFSNDEIKSILDKEKLNYKYIENDDELFDFIALNLTKSKVIGFFDGKAEFGPRALGSRSILADPRNPNAQKLLNEKIKKRESFRPFAPSILEEYGNDFFHDYQFTPFMERVLKIKEGKRKLIPAVTHVDGSGRLQSVNKKLRSRYHKLISKFYELTKIPILINTSFNENEPVVNIPQEAINCFTRTDLDILVLGNYVLEK